MKKIISAILVLAVLGGVFYLFYRKKNGEKKRNTSGLASKKSKLTKPLKRRERFLLSTGWKSYPT